MMDRSVREYLAAIGRRGGQAKVRKGIATLTAKQRKELSKKAAAARWAKKAEESAGRPGHE